MIDLDISFEQSPWETFLSSQGVNAVVSANQLLALLEGEDEQTAEDALNMLESMGLALNVQELPGNAGSGDTAVRLGQEIQLVKNGLNISDMDENDPLRLYLEEIALTPACGDETLLAEQAAHGDENAMLMLTNLGLSRVVQIAKEHVGCGVLLLDLIQEGSLGLWQAIGNYRDGDYASARDRMIRLYMAKAIFLQARARGVGEKLRTAMEDLRQVDERLLGELGRNPTIEELAQELHLDPEQVSAVQKMLDDAHVLLRLKPQEEEESSEDEQAVENTAAFQSRARVLDLLADLEELDAKLLSLRFGLEGGRPLSQQEAAKILGMTQAEAGQREMAALAKLRSK